MSRTWGTHTRCDSHGSLVVVPQNHHALRMTGFDEFGPKNSTTAVLDETGGVTWYHSERCVKAKQLRVERVFVRSKT